MLRLPWTAWGSAIGHANPVEALRLWASSADHNSSSAIHQHPETAAGPLASQKWRLATCWQHSALLHASWSGSLMASSLGLYCPRSGGARLAAAG